MAGELRHRGPDGTGLYLDGRFGMVNTRLAIVDLEGGDQPLASEDGRYWVMQNGEIYNYVELRPSSSALGHRFATTSDTEVIAHAYEEWGAGLPRPPERRLRVRGLGPARAGAVPRARPLRRPPALPRGVRRRPRVRLRGEGAPAPPRRAPRARPGRARRDASRPGRSSPDASAFAGIRELAPAHYLRVGPDGIREERRWWDLDFSAAPDARRRSARPREELDALLDDATRLRLRADVPVAAYLSGGLDSSAIAAHRARADRRDAVLVRRRLRGRALRRERVPGPRRRRARHSTSRASRSVRATSPSCSRARRAVREADAAHGARAAAAALRGRAGRGPQGRADRRGRRRALRRLRHLPRGQGAPLLGARARVAAAPAPVRPAERVPRARPRALGRVPRRLLRAGLDRHRRPALQPPDPLREHRAAACAARRPACSSAAARARRPGRAADRAAAARFGGSAPLGKAQYLEITTFLEGYLLHSQGDRMLMGHSIEGRFPFLDYRVAELARRAAGPAAAARAEEKYVLRKRRRAPSCRRRSPRARSARTARRSCGAFVGPEAPGLRGRAPGPSAARGRRHLLARGRSARLVRKCEAGAPRDAGRRDRRDGARRRRSRRCCSTSSFVADPRLAEAARPDRGSSSATRSVPRASAPSRRMNVRALLHESLLASAERGAGASPRSSPTAARAPTRELLDRVAAARPRAPGAGVRARRPRRDLHGQHGGLRASHLRDAARRRRVRGRQPADEGGQARLHPRRQRGDRPAHGGEPRADRRSAPPPQPRASGPSSPTRRRRGSRAPSRSTTRSRRGAGARRARARSRSTSPR